MQRILLYFCAFVSANAFYYKRTMYGDANEGGVAGADYVNAYYGFPSAPPMEPPRRRPSFNLYPPQAYFRREHPFDFGPFGHRMAMGEANLGEKTDRERAMEKAKPGFWRQNKLETMDRIKKIIGEKRMDMEHKHMQIRRVLANEGAEIRSKFADLHKRLIMKNNKMAASSTVSPAPELSKQAKKLEKEAKKIMENGKMSVEKKQEKLDKLMLKAPESVKAELNAINDSSDGGAPSPLASPPMPSQQEVINRSQQTQAVVEARQIRVSEDGKTVEF